MQKWTTGCCDLKDWYRISRSLIWAASLIVLLLLALQHDGSSRTSQAAPSLAFPSGKENTVIQVQNIGSAPARVLVQFFDDRGAVTGEESVDNLQPDTAWSFYQSISQSLPLGFRGSAAITADQPLETTILKNVQDGSQLSLGLLNGVTRGFTRLLFPVVWKQAGDNWGTRMAITNVSPTQVACLAVTFMDTQARVTSVALPRLPASSPQCPGGGQPLAPHQSLVVDPDTLPEIPAGFVGSALVDVKPNADGKTASIAGDGDIWSGRRFASYNAFGIDKSGGQVILNSAIDDVGEIMMVPVVMKWHGEGRDGYTSMFVQNLDPGRIAHVRVVYVGEGLPDGRLIRDLGAVATAKEVYHVLETGLPDGFIGSAFVIADRPIAVVAEYSRRGSDVYTAFNAIPQEKAASVVRLPLLYSRAGSLPGLTGWNSWFRIQAVDDGDVTVTIRYLAQPDPSCLPTAVQPLTRSFRGSASFDLALPDAWPPGAMPVCFVGAAVIEASMPIAVAVNINADTYTGDTEGMYTGTPVTSSAAAEISQSAAASAAPAAQ